MHPGQAGGRQWFMFDEKAVGPTARGPCATPRMKSLRRGCFTVTRARIETQALFISLPVVLCLRWRNDRQILESAFAKCFRTHAAGDTGAF